MPNKMGRPLAIGASLLLSLLVWTMPVLAQCEPQNDRLKQGETITCEMKGGAVHSYKVSVSEGQFFQIVVEQNGIALIAALKDPVGAQIVQTKGHSGAHGPLYVSEIAKATTGDYELRVSSSESWALPGSYQINLTARTPETADRERIAAERVLAEGQSLLDQAQKEPATASETLPLAVTKFSEAVDRFKVVNDYHGQVMSLHLIGVVYQRFLRKPGEAEKALTAASELSKHLAPNDWRLQATIFNDLGLLYRQMYDQQRARSLLGIALGLFEAKNDRRGKASVFNNLGLSYNDTGEGHKAVELLQMALDIRRLENDKELEINTITTLAGAHDSIGEFHQALELYKSALRRWRELKRTDRYPVSLNNVGFAYERLGRWQEAIDYYLQALASGADKYTAADTLLNLGDLYNKLNDFTRALQSYEKSLRLWQELKNPVEEAKVRAFMGTVYSSLNNPGKALTYLNEARKITERKPDLKDRQAYISIGIGDVYRRQKGGSDAALREFELARKAAESIGDRQQESDAQQKLGETYLTRSDWSNAQESFAKALTLRRKLDDKLGTATTLYHIANLKRDRNQLDEAASASAEALKLFEESRGSILSKQLRTSYFEKAQRSFELYIDVKIQLSRRDSNEKHVAEALVANERAHARSLVEALSETSPVVRQGVSPELLQKRQALAEELNSRAHNRQELLHYRELQQAAHKKNPDPAKSQALTKTEGRLTSLTADINRLISEADDLETQLRRESPGYATLTEPHALTLKQIQTELLDDDTILLEYSLGERRSFAFVVTPTSINAVELRQREEIELVAQRLVAALTVRNLSTTAIPHPSQWYARIAKGKTEYTKAASQLSRLVIDPVASLLGDKRILLVADGALQLTPFAVL
ncbi:MAG TPA: tetratricopeptide repeat protein, partial [Pyrinomonadaceae bacterium]|nr:tetratricopeptide repeat protein [Pyrinomonadaceae bacterium]